MNYEELWRERAYLKDLLDQPAAVERTLAGLEGQAFPASYADGLRSGRWTRVALTGMGSSYWACRPLYLRLLEAGLTPALVETSELIHYERAWLRAETLVVAVSQSGRSAETLRLLELAKGHAEVIGVTNDADSLLAKAWAAGLVTGAGREETVACKTYLASLTGLEWLGDLLCETSREELKRQCAEAAAGMREYLKKWAEHVRELVEQCEGVTDVFVVGRGASLAAAGTAGLILKEATHYHSEGMSSAALRHGPFEMLSAGVMVVALEGDERSAELSRRLVADVRAAGARAELIATQSEGVWRIPECGARALPLVEILPLEMMTLALAAMKGREPGRFERATKVTETE